MEFGSSGLWLIQPRKGFVPSQVLSWTWSWPASALLPVGAGLSKDQWIVSRSRIKSMICTECIGSFFENAFIDVHVDSLSSASNENQTDATLTIEILSQA